MKKWRAPNHDDQLTLPDGHYVFARHHDEHGPRAFLVANLFWDDREMSFLCDSATRWGAVPWSMAPARESHGVEPLGNWLAATEGLAEQVSLLWQAWSDEDDLPAGLLMLRAAMRLQSLARNQKSVGVDVARHCLREELERDAAIRDAKAKAYRANNPDWTPPKMA